MKSLLIATLMAVAQTPTPTPECVDQRLHYNTIAAAVEEAGGTVLARVEGYEGWSNNLMILKVNGALKLVTFKGNCYVAGPINLEPAE